MVQGITAAKEQITKTTEQIESNKNSIDQEANLLGVTKDQAPRL